MNAKNTLMTKQEAFKTYLKAFEGKTGLGFDASSFSGDRNPGGGSPIGFGVTKSQLQNMQKAGIRDRHIDMIAANFSMGYMQNQNLFVAEKVFPNVGVKDKTGKYQRYNQGDWERIQVKLRAPGTGTVATYFDQDDSFYNLETFGLHVAIDIEEIQDQDADRPDEVTRDSAQFITHQLKLFQEATWFENYFKPGIWPSNGASADYIPGTKWDASGSDPIKEVKALAYAMAEQIGQDPENSIDFTCDPHTYRILTEHSTIRGTIIVPTSSEPVNREKLAQQLGVRRVLVAWGIKNKAIKGQANDFGFLAGRGQALLTYSPLQPGVGEHTAGLTFTHRKFQGGDNNIRFRRLYNEDNETWKYEGKTRFDMRIVDGRCGQFLTSLLT